MVFLFFRFLIYGGSTPVGCLLIQFIKLWGGHVTAVCKFEATKVLLALGAHVIIPLDECHVEKELELHDTYVNYHNKITILLLI